MPPSKTAEAADQPDLLGLRDRALIVMMVYSFARVGAVIQMKVSGSAIIPSARLASPPI
jgi:hypothetical protein